MDIIMPQLGETVAEGTVTRWYKNVGDAIKADEALFDVETDKVSTEIPSPVAGVVDEIRVAAGVTAKVGACLAVIREAGAAARPAARVQASTAAAPVPTTGAAAAAVQTAAAGAKPPRAHAGARWSPVVRRLIAEHNLDNQAIARINGSGRD
ncbi:MAG: hypothetical protein FJY56_12045, partial [Betaproteobacteria bacterium]|nr:hypothetical protein [Betaproteobacteria bacterium]